MVQAQGRCVGGPLSAARPLEGAFHQHQPQQHLQAPQSRFFSASVARWGGGGGTQLSRALCEQRPLRLCRCLGCASPFPGARSHSGVGPGEQVARSPKQALVQRALLEGASREATVRIQEKRAFPSGNLLG